MNKEKVTEDNPLLFIFYLAFLLALSLQLASQLKPLVESCSKSLQLKEND